MQAPALPVAMGVLYCNSASPYDAMVWGQAETAK